MIFFNDIIGANFHVNLTFILLFFVFVNKIEQFKSLFCQCF